MIKISASTHLAKDNLLEYVNELETAGIDMIHCDVMDGKFVSDKTIDHTDVEKLNNATTIVLDVHLMVEKPAAQIKKYVKAGADILTVHYEAFYSKRAVKSALKKIQKRGVMSGLCIKPTTPISEVLDLLTCCDLVLVMSVQPGRSGQSFMEESLARIKQIKDYITKNNLLCVIEVDGGINPSNVKQVVDAGASLLVIGSALFNSPERREFLNKIKQKAQ